MNPAIINDPAVRDALRDLNATFRRMNTKLEIASLRIMGKSPFTVHPEIEKRVEERS